MKSKIKIPLVILTFIMILGIVSINLYTFNARETKKLNNNTNLSEKIENNIIENKTSNSNPGEVIEDSSNNIIEDKSESKEENKIVGSTTNEVSKNNNITSNDTNNKTNNESEKEVENSSTSSNDIKEENNEIPETENVKDDIVNEEQDNNKVIIEVPDEENKDNIPLFENDEEYIKLKATLEFETRAECDQAADIIGPKYALQGNLKNASCESFAYKGTVIGFRLKLYFEDGTWIYNN